jgi:purine nucleosidase
MIPIILDTDIGTDVDDALALTLAARSPEIDILAVTTVGADVRLRGRIVRKLLRILDRDEIPVAAGCDRRLNGQEFRPMPIGSVQGFIENEQDGFPLQEKHAVDLIIDILQAANTKITMVLIGPVTNVAMALKRCPQIKEKIERFVVMGGSIYPMDILKKEGWLKWIPGFLRAAMEFNLNADPEAAELILNSGIPILLVPAEITFRTYLTKQERAQLRQSTVTQSAQLNHMCDEFQAMLSKTTARIPVDRQFAQVYLHDPLTVATVFTQDFVTVEAFHLTHRKRFGVFRTVPQNRLPANAVVVTDLDESEFKRLFAERVFGITLH